MSASRLTRDNKPNRSPLRKSQENSNAGRKLVISDFTCCFSHRSHAPGNLYLAEGYLPAARRRRLFEKRTSTPIALSPCAEGEPVHEQGCKCRRATTLVRLVPRARSYNVFPE